MQRRHIFNSKDTREGMNLIKNDIVAPVAKTLFIPRGNPGVQKVNEILAVPVIKNAEGNLNQLTVSGDMEIKVYYEPIQEPKDDILWKRSVNLEEGDYFSNEEQGDVLARLEDAVKEAESDGINNNEENLWELELKVPFTIAIETELLDEAQIVKFQPMVDSINWFILSPEAVEFEGVLRLSAETNQAELNNMENSSLFLTEENGVRESESGQIEEFKKEETKIQEFIPREEITQSILEDDPKEIDQELENELMENKREEQGVETDTKSDDLCEIVLEKEHNESPDEEWVKVEPDRDSLDSQERKDTEENISNPKESLPSKEKLPDVKLMYQTVPDSKEQPVEKNLSDSCHVTANKKAQFRMRFYLVQSGEDLDAIAYKFGITRESICQANLINEEEVRTGMLLSIPNQ